MSSTNKEVRMQSVLSRPENHCMHHIGAENAKLVLRLHHGISYSNTPLQTYTRLRSHNLRLNRHTKNSTMHMPHDHCDQQMMHIKKRDQGDPKLVRVHLPTQL